MLSDFESEKICEAGRKSQNYYLHDKNYNLCQIFKTANKVTTVNYYEFKK